MSGSAPVEVLPDGIGPPPRTRPRGLAVSLVVAAVIAIGAFLWGRGRWELRGIRAEAAWLSAGLDGEAIERVASEAGDVYYHARLLDVPLGRTLEIECEWFDPAGTTVRQVRYETRVVDHEPWPTHCLCRFEAATPGTWRVLMSLAGRELSETAFPVEPR